MREQTNREKSERSQPPQHQREPTSPEGEQETDHQTELTAGATRNEILSTRTFDLVDGRGEKICNITLVCDDETTSTNGQQLTQLRSVQLQRSASSEPVDLLELTGVDPNMRVFMRQGDKDHCIHHCGSSGYIVCNSIDSLQSLSEMLHELGHEAQYAEEPYKTLRDIHEMRKNVGSRTLPLNDIEKIKGLVPETAPIIEQNESIQELTRIGDGLEETGNRSLRLHASSPQPESSGNALRDLGARIASGVSEWWNRSARQQEQQALRSEILDLYRQQRELNEDPSLQALGILPTRIIERDANRRVAHWLEEVNEKTGIDLNQPISSENLMPPFEYLDSTVQRAYGATDEALAEFGIRMTENGVEKI